MERCTKRTFGKSESREKFLRVQRVKNEVCDYVTTLRHPGQRGSIGNGSTTIEVLYDTLMGLHGLSQLHPKHFFYHRSSQSAVDESTIKREDLSNGTTDI